MTIAAKTITLKGNGVQSEGVANAAVKPGMLVELLSTGKSQAHGTQGGGGVEKMFAIENELEGQGIDDDYAADDVLFQKWYNGGDWVNALLANGENASIGDKLDSNGDGYLRVQPTIDATTLAGSTVAIAMADVDMSGSSGEDPSGRIPVRPA